MQRSALCGSRRELSNAYFLAKIRFDTAENELAKNLKNLAIFPNFAKPAAALRDERRGAPAEALEDLAADEHHDDRRGT